MDLTDEGHQLYTTDIFGHVHRSFIYLYAHHHSGSNPSQFLQPITNGFKVIVVESMFFYKIMYA
jgi:hypothetical protein